MSEIESALKQQKKASNPDSSAWVFASAGSGKTKVLTDRVLRLLLSGVLPNKILCLTYTKAAASEMQQRIYDRLANWSVIDDNELIKELNELDAGNFDLKKARTLFAKILEPDFSIKIQTIHSFCQSLAKIFPFEMEISPNFEVLEGGTERLLLMQARKEVFVKAKYNSDLANAIKLINSGLDEETFLDLTAKILDEKEQLIFLKNYFFTIENVILEIFKKNDIAQDERPEKFFNEFLEKFDQEKFIEIAKKLENAKQKTNVKTAQNLIKFIKNPIFDNLFLLREIFFTKDNEFKKTVITKDFIEFDGEFCFLQNSLKDFFEKLNSYKIANITAALLHFVDAILIEYTQIKKKNSYLDYNDLIILTDKILKNPNYSDWIKFKMDGFFDHILIDESQDTNHHQWNIIKSLSEDFFAGVGAHGLNRTIFIIGDDKQSIFSFQGSDPNISNEIYSYYQEKLSSAFTLNKVDLDSSFRSSKKILEFVDLIFKDSRHMGSLEYQSHKAIRKNIGRVEIWPQIKNKNDENNVGWQNHFLDEQKYNEKDFLAENITLKIKDWIQKGRAIKDKNGQLRAIKYSDIMILLRNRVGSFDRILQKHFKANNLPFQGTRKINFSHSLLIQDILSAARFTLLTKDDLTLACLLKSPFFSFDEERLFKVAIIKNEKENSLFEALKLSEPIIAEQLEKLIEKSLKLSVLEFFSNILTFAVKNKMIENYGHEAIQIIDQFLLIVINYCKNNLANLEKFLEFCEKTNPQIAVLASKNDEVVITTIHSAKGLQAPIVIIPDSSFNFNQTTNAKENLFWSDLDLEEDIKLPIFCPKKSDENMLVKNLKQINKIQALEEYFRLFYVALTRAEEELYLMGFGAATALNSWYEVARLAIKDKAQELDFVDQIDEKLKIKSENFIINDKMLRFGENEDAFISSSQDIKDVEIDQEFLQFIKSRLK